jgi:hypothetical protein
MYVFFDFSLSLSLFFLFFYLCNFPGIWTLFRGRRRAAVKLSLNLSLPMDDLGPMLKNEWTRRERKKRNMFPQQGCQMLHVLRTKKTIRVYFGGPWSGKCWYIYDHWEYFTTIGNILWPFGIFCGHQVVYFIALWYILWLFGILFPFLVSCNKKNLATQFHSLSLDFYIKLSSSIRLNSFNKPAHLYVCTSDIYAHISIRVQMYICISKHVGDWQFQVYFNFSTYVYSTMYE